MRHRFILVASFLTLAVFLSGCISCTESFYDKLSSFYDELEDYAYDEEEEEEGPDGTYYWEHASGRFSYKVIIDGNTWYGSSMMGDEFKFEQGRVAGNDIYDSSGFFVIANIYGDRINWGGRLSLRKQ